MSFTRPSRTYRAVLSAMLAVAVPAALVLPALPAAAAPTTDQARLQQAVGALRAIQTMQADFVQTDRAGQTLRGTLTLKRPGRIRFQYQPGVPMLIVGDGKALTLVDYEVRQVQRWPIGNSPLGALIDPKRDVGKFGRLMPTDRPEITSVEVRDRGHPEYGVITLIFVQKPSAPGGMELASWVALDAQNKRTIIRLSNQRYGVSVSDNMFRYKDPRPQGRK